MEEKNITGLPSYTGFRSRVIRIGQVEVGGDRPIRVQSMTNTPTLDTAATVGQVLQLAEAGCELVRITARNTTEARHLQIIKKELKKRGTDIPLIADIHFLPEAAEIAARIVEKVRINPGNYTDAKNKWQADISDKEYKEGLERIALRLRPLLGICREHGTVIRIGTNHGSLSDRIVQRYGNTPEGMVESALEFARICRGFAFHDLVLSMKASNILTVLHANRLLSARMKAEGMDYPIHLGVTEAGEGEDGRIKSAAGIGILLSEGIGDTIRVSLTEDPVQEIPFARNLAAPFHDGAKRKFVEDIPEGQHPYHYERHRTNPIGGFGGGQFPAVVSQEFPTQEFPTAEFPTLKFPTPKFPTQEFPTPVLATPGTPAPADILLLHSPPNESALTLRHKINVLTGKNPTSPLLIRKDLGELSGDTLLIRAAINLGMPLTDGFGDGVQLVGGSGMTEGQRVKLAFDILQATGRRITKTEYISCPSCGRTQFDIQSALKKVKEKTSHLVGLKIAVMGCIVNGPGEMADADYGYVGAGPGKVHIYKGQTLVKRNVPEQRAVEELLTLIGNYQKPAD